MATAPRLAERSSSLLHAYAREPGRSVFARVQAAGAAWEGGVAEDAPRPAASLLKVPLALAAEEAAREGRLDAAAPVPLEELLELPGAGPLHVLHSALDLTVADVLGLSIAWSNRACATWLLTEVGVDTVRAAASAAGCAATTIGEAPADDPGGPLAGQTTARDALRLLAAAADERRHPLTAGALRHTALNSRIPLGADGADVDIAHKTGTLAGVANDVAVIDCHGGRLDIAFLTAGQHDTLVSGYEMGICTRELLAAWGLAVSRSRSIA
jgi:beta-lactamase class A